MGCIASGDVWSFLLERRRLSLSGTTAGRIRSTSEAAGLLIATIDENSSGADDPAAINVAPATSSERLLQTRCVRS